MKDDKMGKRRVGREKDGDESVCEVRERKTYTDDKRGVKEVCEWRGKWRGMM